MLSQRLQMEDALNRLILHKVSSGNHYAYCFTRREEHPA
jgi:hypothetical protein